MKNAATSRRRMNVIMGTRTPADGRTELPNPQSDPTTRCITDVHGQAACHSQKFQNTVGEIGIADTPET